MFQRRRLFASVLGALGLVSVAHAGQTAVDDEVFGPGYRMQVFHGELKPDPFRLFLLLHLTDADGKIKACGVLVADMSDRRFNEMANALRDPSSFIRLGERNSGGYHVRPSFLAAKRAIVTNGPDGRPKLPLQGLQAHCVVTDGVWEARYANEPFTLELRQTRFGSMLYQW